MKTLAALVICLLLSPGFAWGAEVKADIIRKKTPYGEISYPQMSQLADKNIEKSINETIAAAAATWTCDFEGETGDPGKMSYDALSTLRLVDEHYLSFTIAQDYYCGGAYPDAHTDVMNFDLQTGEPVPVNALLVAEMQDEKLTEYLLAHHKFETEGCGDGYEEIDWDYYRTADKIVFLPRLSHAAQACVEEFPVPIADLKDYMPTEMEEDRE